MNEILFIAITFIVMSSVVFAARMGRVWLYALIPILLIIANITAANLSIAFGVVTSLAIPIYAAIFLATDTIGECFGRREGFRAVGVGFFAQIMLIVFGFLITAATPLQEGGLSQAVAVVFGYVPRIAAGSFVAYLISQLFDVWFFHKVKQATGGKWLWLRNTGSTTISQGIDTFVFLMIAFYGVLPDFREFMLSTWIIKMVVAALDTPFLYFARAAAERATEADSE